MTLLRGLLIAAILMVPACDNIRYPGDGRDDEYNPEIPPGAPGPAPPAEPVDDPYDTGETDEGPVSDPLDTPDPDPETDPSTDPDPLDPVDTDDPDTVPDPTEPVDTETPDPTETDAADPEGPDAVDPTETDAADPEEPDPADLDPADPSDSTPVTDTPDPEPEPVVVFSYVEPGQLLQGSGTGTIETEAVFAPDMRFPIKSAPAYLQSQVWMFGGGIKGGDQCDPRNYQYPWRDNFCETRSSNRNSPYCPVSRIHQGQDIRVGTAEGCNQLRRTNAAERALYEVVAAEDGIIQSIGTYTVSLRAGPRVYKYMHMNMRALQVSSGDTVTKGQTLGYVSNDFGGTPTTFHLHFELLQNTAEGGWVHVPPYTSLVSSYEDRESGIGEKIEATIGVASTPPPIPEGFVIIE
ncbi:MAG: peptidoglycan DD-metalloendopeptidase family protein [Henriciella sp.]|uniref:M23 family metallopeptidase n=1 Tax=Henriciella sp. TaxID=1968823 RepID=UPI003C754207